MDIVQKRQELRFRYLQLLYELKGGDESEYVSDSSIMSRLDAERNEIEKAIKYLESERLISYTTGRQVRFTHQGVKEVEAKLANPLQATAHFPQVVNILNVGQMNDSQIQQGTIDSNQADWGTATGVADLHGTARKGASTAERETDLQLEFAELEREASLGNSIQLQSTYCEMPPPDVIPDLDRDYKETFDNNMEVTVVIPSNKEYYRERAEYIFATKFYRPVRFLVTNPGVSVAQNVRVEISIVRQDGVGVVLQSEMPIEPDRSTDAALTQQNRPAGRDFVDRHAGRMTIETHADKFKVVVECGTLQPKRLIASDIVFLGREESGQIKLTGLIYADNLATPKAVELLAGFTVARKEVSVMSLTSFGYR